MQEHNYPAESEHLAHNSIRGLSQRLSEAEAMIETLLAGRVKSGIDSTSLSPEVLWKSQATLRVSEARYQAIVENQTELICCWLPDDTITFANEAFCRYFGQERSELIGCNFTSYLPVEDQARLAEYLATPDQANPTITMEYRLVSPGGEVRWQMWTNRAIFDDQGQVVEFQAVGRDITERKQAEEELQRRNTELELQVRARTAELEVANKALHEINERKQTEAAVRTGEEQLRLALDNASVYQAAQAELSARQQAEAAQARLLEENRQQRQFLERLVENVPAGIAFLNGPEHRYVLANPAYRHIAWDRGELTGRTVAEVWPEAVLYLVPVLDRVYQTGQPFSAVDVPFTIQRDTGPEEGNFTIGFIRIDGEQNQPEGVVILILETTEQVRARQEADEAHALLDTIFESAPVGLGFWNRELEFTRLNKALAETNGMPVEAHLGKTPLELLPGLEGLDQAMTIWRQILETGEPVLNVEISGETPAAPGRKRFWLENWYPVCIQGEIIGIGAVVEEITDRKQAEQQLKVALQEKEILLRELNHRVKNNFQAISNLIHLEAQTIQDPQVRQKFEATQNRIRSIGLIYEKLYQGKNLSRLSFTEYMESLGEHLIQSYRVYPERVRLKIESDETRLGTETILFLGTIVNELVTNALKYAFPDNRPGEIGISLKMQENGWLRLTVSDNGTGFPAGKDLSSVTDSLGLQLVQMLVGHIDGTVELARENGARFTITFKPGRAAK